MSRILAIDYGTKRTGIAVTDELKIIAISLATVPTKDLLFFLKKYLPTEKVECLVIGKPVNLDGRHSEMEKNIQSFIAEFQKTFPQMKIERMDERFTSQIAQRIIFDSGIGKAKRRDKSLADKISAMLILQSYLETLRS